MPFSLPFTIYLFIDKLCFFSVLPIIGANKQFYRIREQELLALEDIFTMQVVSSPSPLHLSPPTHIPQKITFHCLCTSLQSGQCCIFIIEDPRVWPLSGFHLFRARASLSLSSSTVNASRALCYRHNLGIILQYSQQV